MTDATKYTVQGITKCGNTVTFEGVEMYEHTFQTIANKIDESYRERKGCCLSVGLTLVNVLEGALFNQEEI